MRKLIVFALLIAVIATLAFSSTALATSPQPASIVDALAASAANNPAGSATDCRWTDFDILLAVVSALPFDAVGDPGGAKLVDVLKGFTGTVFAPADASFRGLVSDLTNTPIWRLSEAKVLQTLLDIAAAPDLNGTGIPGVAALSETVRYHVTAAQIPDLKKAAYKCTSVITLTQLPALGLSDGVFELKRPCLGIVSLRDDDKNDLDPFWFGQTIRCADGGTIHAIAGVLRPLDLKVLFPFD